MGLFFEDIDLPPLTGPFSLEEDLGLAPLEAQAPPSHKWARQLLSADQFTLFQLGENGIIDLHQAEPVQEGSDEQPDMRVAIELVSFNIPSSVGIDENKRATLRLDVGEQAPANARADALFWAIAAGFDLSKTRALKAIVPEFKASLVQSFARQPIDLAGSLGTVRIAIVAHGEPPWWRKVFKFGANDLVSDAFSIIGFPAVTSRALRLIDSFFEHLQEANPQVLIHSHPINVAFSRKARNDFDLGLKLVKVAVLNPGWYVMMRYADVPSIKAHDPVYLGGYGTLVSKTIAEENTGVSHLWTTLPTPYFA